MELQREYPSTNKSESKCFQIACKLDVKSCIVDVISVSIARRSCSAHCFPPKPGLRRVGCLVDLVLAKYFTYVTSFIASGNAKIRKQLSTTLKLDTCVVSDILRYVLNNI